MKAHIDKPWETKVEWWRKTKMKEFAGTARTSMHLCLEKVLPALTEEAGRYWFINWRVGLGKDEHTDMGIIRVIFNESSWSSWTQRFESNRMFMNVYLQEIKYLFSIVQKWVLVIYDETLNVEVIDSNDPYSGGQQQKSTCSQIPSYVFEKFLNQQKRRRDGMDSWWKFRQQFLNNFYGIDGEPFEFEWSTLPRLASLELLRECQEDLIRRNIDLEKFEERIIFICQCSTA